MRSLISEFSYGFALTHELVLSLGRLTAAPVFPSLIEEGKSGGGYDVKLDAPGIPLFLQFKRSDCLSRRSAREIKAGAGLNVPFYRMRITGKDDSDQHEMLIGLDTSPNLVFYAAPMFHQKSEFDSAFLTGTVRQNSFFVRPADIGYFSDDAAHHVSFDGRTCVVMSRPKAIEAYGVLELEKALTLRLDQEQAEFRISLPIALSAAETARDQAKNRFDGESRSHSVIEDESQIADISQLEEFKLRQASGIPAAEMPAMPKDPEMAALRKLADIGLRDFNAQLYIVQTAD